MGFESTRTGTAELRFCKTGTKNITRILITKTAWVVEKSIKKRTFGSNKYYLVLDRRTLGGRNPPMKITLRVNGNSIDELHKQFRKYGFQSLDEVYAQERAQRKAKYGYNAITKTLKNPDYNP